MVYTVVEICGMTLGIAPMLWAGAVVYLALLRNMQDSG